MKKNPKKTLIIIGVLLLIILNVCIGVILINNDKKKEDTNNNKDIVSPDTPQVGDGIPSGVEASVIKQDLIMYEKIKIRINEEATMRRNQNYKVWFTHSGISRNDAPKIDDYRLMKCFKIYTNNRRGYVEIDVSITGVSPDDLLLYGYTDNNWKERKRLGNEHSSLYNLPSDSDFCFYIKNNESNS